MAKKILTTNHSTNFKQALSKYVAKNVKSLYVIEDLNSDAGVTIIGTSCPTTYGYGNDATGYIVKSNINNKRVLTEGDVLNTGNICYAKPVHCKTYFGNNLYVNLIISYVLQCFIGDNNSPYGTNDFLNACKASSPTPAAINRAYYGNLVATYASYTEGLRQSTHTTGSWPSGPFSGLNIFHTYNSPGTGYSNSDYVLCGVEPYIYGLLWSDSLLNSGEKLTFYGAYKSGSGMRDPQISLKYVGNIGAQISTHPDDFQYMILPPLPSGYSDNTLPNVYAFAAPISSIRPQQNTQVLYSGDKTVPIVCKGLYTQSQCPLY